MVKQAAIGRGEPQQKRPYEMRSRARSVEATRERILQATFDLMFECSYDELTLQRVADRAGTTFQTVLRHFGSKDGLIGAVADWGSPREFGQRMARRGDPHDVARVLCERYEATADATMQWEALEDRVEVIAEGLRRARNDHRAWLEDVFEPQLRPLTAASRSELLALLYAASDINTWRLWRRRLGLTPAQARRAMHRLLAAALDASRTHAPARSGRMA